jgi:hypothetical protein
VSLPSFSFLFSNTNNTSGREQRRTEKNRETEQNREEQGRTPRTNNDGRKKQNRNS